MPFLLPINPVAGQTYGFNSQTWEYNGYAWNKLGITLSGGGGGSNYLNDLLDVTISGVTESDVLYYSNTASQWINKPLDSINIDGGTY